MTEGLVDAMDGLEMPLELDLLRSGILALESLLILATFLHLTLFVRVLWHLVTFHSNLKILVGNLVAALTLSSLIRVLLILFYFHPDLPDPRLRVALEAAHSGCFLAFLATLLFIFLERCVSTLCARGYETCTAWLAALLACGVSWALLAGHTVFCFVSPVAFDIFPGLMVVGTVSMFISFLILKRLNRHIHRVAYSRPLSERYQLVENIRVTHTMVWVAFWTSVSVTFPFAYFLMYYLWIVPNRLHYAFAIVSHTLDCCMALFSLLFPLPFVCTHPEVRRRYLRTRSGRVGDVEELRDHFTSIDGVNMVHQVQEHAEVYFHQLRKQWN